MIMRRFTILILAIFINTVAMYPQDKGSVDNQDNNKEDDRRYLLEMYYNLLDPIECDRIDGWKDYCYRYTSTRMKHYSKLVRIAKELDMKLHIDKEDYVHHKCSGCRQIPSDVYSAYYNRYANPSQFDDRYRLQAGSDDNGW